MKSETERGRRLRHATKARWRLTFFGVISPKTFRLIARLCIAAVLGGMWAVPQNAYAQDATWLLNPLSGEWNTAANWNPAIVPSGTAIFGASNITSVAIGSAKLQHGDLANKRIAKSIVELAKTRRNQSRSFV